MAILYKYMSYIDNYLSDPTIKLSPPSLLNDPFESQDVEDMRRFIYESYLASDNRDVYVNGIKVSPSRAKRIIENEPMSIVNSSGVISLSESNRSLLMWAHYANQHKGIVIGLEDDFLYDELNHIPYSSRLILEPKPIKISYDTIRFDLTDFENFPENRHDIANMLAMKLLTTKSDDWLYEKEHRCIVPIGIADKIIYTGKITDRTRRVKNYISNEQIKINRTTKIVTVSDDIEYKSPVYRWLSRDDKFLFLKRISPKKIKSIYFGVRADDDDIANMMETISKNKEMLGHIKVYKYELCDRQFSIIKEQIPSDFHITYLR
ncbi:DUF2971 domain-containing protein [Aeromonas veronii]|uniref:DUF2971 domain-containing protein n=1 Tax=Aeromonas veronii TaxID=654 RepID=UPI00191FFC3A|nr:DUF2971 domain-containing protein [Aeromonas veronii]MBL0492748.1 DUF2971 domain-containing protein [Aeromonas veronii]